VTHCSNFRDVIFTQLRSCMLLVRWRKLTNNCFSATKF